MGGGKEKMSVEWRGNPYGEGNGTESEKPDQKYSQSQKAVETTGEGLDWEMYEEKCRKKKNKMVAP